MKLLLCLKNFNLLYLVLLLLLQNSETRGCIESERLALLEFKAFLQLQGYDAHRLLPSWDDEPNSECCGWERVTCNGTSGHVTELSLSNIRQFDADSLSADGNILLLDTSSFQPLRELRVLNLSHNVIGGWADSRGSGMWRLKNLETLDLRSNKLNKSLIPTLNRLPSLKKLILAANQLEGSFPANDLASFEVLQFLDLSHNSLDGSTAEEDSFSRTKSSKHLSKLRTLKHLDLSTNSMKKSIFKILGQMSSLEYLDLSFNLLEAPLSNGSESLSKLRKLKHIDLSANFFDKSIFRILSKLSSLKHLDLSYNFLEGPLPFGILNISSLNVLNLQGNFLNGTLSKQGLCRLKRLQELDLSENGFEGILPPCLRNLTSLRLLDLSQNKLMGTFSSSLISSLTSLEYIDVGHNLFDGLFSFGSFANHSKLEVVQFISDNDKFEIEADDPNWVPEFQLKVLVLSNCNLNKLTNRIPAFLLHQQQLKVIDLSHNKLKGSFPRWLMVNNTGIEFLILRNNSLGGELYMPPFPLFNAVWVDVSDNSIKGQIQENIGKLLPNLTCLNLSSNSFEGHLPSSVGDMKNLEVLDLSSNNFSGEVPKTLVATSSNLQYLKLSNNSFYGKFFSAEYNLSSLRVLQLNDNKFIGRLSNIRFNSVFKHIRVFDVGNNQMSGEIPNWIGDMRFLQILNMRNNSFKGHIRCEPFSGRFVDLSHNFLSESLPSCHNMQNLEQIHLQGNAFTGSLPKAFLNSSSLLVLNVRDNNLSGSIPGTIGALSNLRVVLLRGNRFGGLIPKQLCQLRSISLMDFSGNSFSGSIPECFSNISFGKMDITYPSISEKLTYFFRNNATYEVLNLTKKDFLGGGTSDEIESRADIDLRVEIEFVTKNWPGSYKGGILNIMSGLDLSGNMLTGEIPPELGNLSSIRALNFSYNQLTGSIPKTFARLSQIESMDLSHNKLSGEIPSELIGLNFLAVFLVAYNNLSGRTPGMEAQFGTFCKSSYEGNPLLCGPPLQKRCKGDDGDEPPPSPMALPHENDIKWYDVDPEVFFASFSASFVMFFLGFIALLYFNPNWRRRMFYNSEEFVFSCYYFVCDALSKFFSPCFCRKDD